MTRSHDPPLRVAWQQALASIRVRFMRQAITALGISLGIAFFTSVLVLRLTPSDDPQAGVRLQWLVATSLLMCLVGITNSMLMSVTERYREIGTIKCLGASDGFIVKVFFFEAMLLGLIGSASGSLLGTGLMALVQRLMGNTFRLASLGEIAIVGIGLGLLLTVISAIAPAIQAARMPAAAALRMEI
jgi:putative ABC transport system permease protein